jgi:tetratricopeptide (TPR) repeat protein
VGDHAGDETGVGPTRPGHGNASPTARTSEPLTTGTMSTARDDLPTEPGAFAEAWPESDRYALVREIARGGGGRIAVAMDRKLGRRIALKQPLDRGGGQRLEREAMVMARLEHPAIVPIHDAGRGADGTPFYAMKLLGGPNLSQRIREATTFEQRLGLLRVVGAVADAMAYAHAQGVIHRDLKPANVVVGEFGEVAVIDWGLAKAIGDVEVTPGASSISAELTVDGAVMGTPAYMPPEQATGGVVDARADVYALGAMLYQVLAGETPYGKLAGRDQLARLAEGPPPAVDAREPRVPADLAAIVGKAMARDAEDRYPTARELADDLHRYETGKLVAAHRYSPIARARRWVRRHAVAVAVAAAAIAASGALFFAMRRGAQPAATCDGADEAIAGVWDGARRERARAAFRGASPSYATSAWARASDELDRYRGAWIGAHTEACRATRIEGQQSEAMLDLRMACLAGRRAELDALAGQLEHTDDGVITHAVDAALALAPIADCADTAALLVEDAARHGRAPIAPEWQARVARVKAATDVGRWPQALDDAKQLTADADVRADVAARAQAWALRGNLEDELDDARAAEPDLQVAIRLATEAGDDATAANAIEDLAYVLDDDPARRGEAVLAAKLGDALVTRLPEGAPERSNLLLARSDALRSLQRFDEAHAAITEAIGLLEKHGAPKRVLLGRAYALLAQNRNDVGAYDDARAQYQRALDVFEQALGPDHPKVSQLLNNMGSLELNVGNLPAAEADFRRSLEIKEHVLGPDALAVANTADNLGLVYDEMNRADDAAAQHERALAIYEAKRGPEHGDVARVLGHLGMSRRLQGKVDEAIAMQRRALAIELKVYGADSRQAAETHINLANALLDQGDLRGAEAEIRSGLDADVKVRGADHPIVLTHRLVLDNILAEEGRCAEALPDLQHISGVLAKVLVASDETLIGAAIQTGRCQIDLGHARDAIAGLEAVVAGAAQNKLDPATLATARFELARALWDGGGDRARAVALAADSEPVLSRAAKVQQVRIAAWRRAHPGR